MDYGLSNFHVCSCKVVSAFLESSDSDVRELARKELQPMLDSGALKLPETMKLTNAFESPKVRWAGTVSRLNDWLVSVGSSTDSHLYVNFNCIEILCNKGRVCKSYFGLWCGWVKELFFSLNQCFVPVKSCISPWTKYYWNGIVVSILVHSFMYVCMKWVTWFLVHSFMFIYMKWVTWFLFSFAHPYMKWIIWYIYLDSIW